MFFFSVISAMRRISRIRIKIDEKSLRISIHIGNSLEPKLNYILAILKKWCANIIFNYILTSGTINHLVLKKHTNAE
jgi:hypothetical protein